MPGGKSNYGTESYPQDGSVARGNAGFLAPGQTKIGVNIDNVATTGSTVTIPLPTPPTGKVWLITDMNFTHNQSTGQRFALTVGGVTIFSTQCHGSSAPDIFGTQETQPDCPQGVAPALVIAGTSGMQSWANITGIQQNIGQG